MPSQLDLTGCLDGGVAVQGRDHSPTASPVRFNHIRQPRLSICVERIEGLIEQPQFAILQAQPRQSGAPFLPGREHAAWHIGWAFQAHFAENSRNICVAAPDPCPMIEVRTRCFMCLEPIGVPDPMVQDRSLNRSSLRLGQARQLPEQCGFAGTIGAAQQDQFAGRRFERDVLKQHTFTAHRPETVAGNQHWIAQT